MSDTAYPVFQHYGTNAQRLAFTPAPAAGTQPLYIWYETDTNNYYIYTTAWKGPFATGGGGTVTNTGTLTSGKTIIGNGGVDVTVSSLTAQFVGSSSGTAAAASMTTNRILGRTTAGSGAVEEITPGASLVFSAGALNGRIVQVVNTETGATASGTTAIPIDDTIPQNTEGDQYMSLAITPTSATNKLKIDVTLFCSNSANDTWLIAALFQDTTANALAAGAVVQPTNVRMSEVTFTHVMTAGTTSATTFKVRAGGQTGTFVFNGNNSGRLLGGALASSITITEISV